ncbi:F0F1 ATP synthase subunit delta [Magnetospirillum molischianum]|uniref:ATP synthase subunit delta n=1 Tax=Magnetospirillum molischianum DSM 120 TaxID=1150626 RepID=H8FT43_MAGML|nr:F0F1 ATP synthase subunit delta [Magnetospirillum molischianum]CCG41531.1 ATP synthase subunit delta, membrane-bound, F1 sector [Magnetospirillum molischianum DSM 120]
MPSETIGVIADRYAGALFELAEAQNGLDDVAGDLRTLKAMLHNSADLRRLVGSPVLSRAEQGRAIVALAKAAGFTDLTTRFLGLAAKSRRLFLMDAAINSYLGRLAARRGERTAEVVSAVPLSQDQQDALSTALRTAFGGSVAVEVKVDPGLLGGLVVKVGSQMVDSSLKTKLQHLKLAMKGVG